MFIKDLIGHSGCKLTLIGDGVDLFVRKQANSEYSYRLKKQCIKQNKFKSDTVYVPQILKSGFTDNSFYFDMEYIKGKTLACYVSSLTVKDISSLVKILFNNLYLFEKIDPNVNHIFSKKIQTLSVPQNSASYELFESAKKILLNYDFSYVYKSPCHGDLTLENIIVTPNKNIYLIDFLDSFYNSWIIDIAKLLQDIELKWSYRYEREDTTRNVRLLVAKNALFEELQKMNNGEKLIETVYHVLLLNILRIYPYVKDEITAEFLKISTIKIIDIINTLKKEVLV